MIQTSLLLAVLGASLACDAAAAASFDPRSTPDTPCGIGVPPPGHAMPELRPGADGLVLTVKQDKDRLCYVAAGDADAPVIRVRQGAALAVTLRNEISDPAAIAAITAPGRLKTANRRVPPTTGFLAVVPGEHHAATGATNLHLHGFAVPPVAPQDDVMTVCTDPAAGPARCGQRQFTYRFQLPTDMPAGLYWYHPHVHGETQAQMLMGLAGALVVEGAEDDARRAAGIDERVLVVRQLPGQDDDATADRDADDAAATSHTRPAPRRTPAPATRPKPGTATRIDTAHGVPCAPHADVDALSLNGTPVPTGDAPDAAIAHYTIAAGHRQLWRILNAATDTFLALALVDADGHALPLEVVARDGSPLADDAGHRLHPPATRAPLALPPAGRVEVLVAAPPPGAKAWLLTRAIDSGCAGDPMPERRLALLTAAEAPRDAATPTAMAEAASIPGFFDGLVARKTDRTRSIALAEYLRPGREDATDFYIAERKPGAVLRPYRMGDAPAITVQAGTTEEWIIENWTRELHTFHIHQVHFRVLEVDGQALAEPPLLDVVEVPYATAAGADGTLRPGRVRVKMSFPDELAGDIPFHCHLVEHEDNGMMAVLRVLPADGRPIVAGHGMGMGAMHH